MAKRKGGRGLSSRPQFPAVSDTNAPPFGNGRASSAPRTPQQPDVAPRIKPNGYVDQRSTRTRGQDGARTRGFAEPAQTSIDRSLQRDSAQSQRQASVNVVNNNPPLRDVARQWQGTFQQQPRRSPMRGDPKPIQAPDFNPSPTDAAIGLGTVKREMPTGYMPVSDTIIWNTANAADEFPKWGAAPRARDQMLRSFLPTEPIADSAFSGTVQRYASLEWELEAPPATARAVMQMMHGCERGKGWQALASKVGMDYLTQDNGAFIEIVRLYADPLAPVVSLNHLDAGRCVRTGRWEEPVVYIDMWGVHHRMLWYQVADLTDMPSPIEMARGMQYSALSRVLTASQIMRDITTFMREKVSGQFNKAIHLVGGVQSKTISEALQAHKDEAQQQGLIRYLQPAVVASLDPNSKVSTARIDLASLPESWDYDSQMKWYLTIIAMALGGDYQDFAPLSGGGLGSGGSGHSSMLHMKSRGKGLQTWMNNWEQLLNFHGIMPQNCLFRYKDPDTMEEMEEVELGVQRAQGRQVRIMSGEITPEVSRDIARDAGDLTQEQWSKLAADPNAPASTPPAAFPGGPPMAKPGGLKGEDTGTNAKPGGQGAGATTTAGGAGSTVGNARPNGKGNTVVGRADPGKSPRPGLTNTAQKVQTARNQVKNQARRTTVSSTTPRTKELTGRELEFAWEQQGAAEPELDRELVGA